MAGRALKNDPSDKMNYFNIACLYALLNQPDKALDFLEVAVTGASNLKKESITDGDLISLRNHPRFITMMEE